MAQEGKLSDHDKSQLLRLARETLKYYLHNGSQPEISDLSIELTNAMQEQRAAFVTLHKDHQLRGCIGDILPRGPLYQSVMRNAINAGVNDYRFSSVTPGEMDKLDFEISALTVPTKVASYKNIRIGIDGMILQKNGRSAVFLPQVAPEQGWDIAETLTHLSMKAGLSSDAWKEGTEFHVFQAEVFGEKP